MKSDIPPKMPRLGMVRVGSVLGAMDVLRELGCDPEPLVRKCGLSPEIFRDSENEVPYLALLRLLDLCASASGAPHFGLLVGARNDLSSLGLIGHLAQNAPDVGTALRTLTRRFGIHDRGAHASLQIEGESAKISYVLDHPGAPGAEHGRDVAIATACNILRTLCGKGWAPTFVHLPRSPPPDTTPYTQFFGANVAFGAEAAAVSFQARWLSRPVPGSNKSLYLFLEQLAEQAERPLGTQAEDIRRIIRLQLLEAKVDIGRAASMLGIHRRTLARHLSAEGVTFRELVREVRRETAEQLLKNTNATMIEIAHLLGFADQTTFSRAFSNWYGHPPSTMRATSR